MFNILALPSHGDPDCTCLYLRRPSRCHLRLATRSPQCLSSHNFYLDLVLVRDVGFVTF